jgi:hypothetical protein
MKKFLIISLFVVGLSGIAYWIITKVPKVTILSVDQKNLTAKIQIGSQVIDYTYNKDTAFEVGNVGFLYKCEIVPVGSSSISADIQIRNKMNDDLFSTDIIYFGPNNN